MLIVTTKSGFVINVVSVIQFLYVVFVVVVADFVAKLLLLLLPEELGKNGWLYSTFSKKLSKLSTQPTKPTNHQLTVRPPDQRIKKPLSPYGKKKIQPKQPKLYHV